ncbi:MAG: hypothetical protein JW765_10875 [Deltaproteobacteria bacterium]|nr:hypothetical protein [Candidatus Zymogenaceae bacterium]
MKRLVPCLAVALLLVSITPAVFAGEMRTVEASLDASCTTRNGAFTVPPGTTAVNFSATMSSPWRACSVDMPIDTIGFMIVDSNDKTYYTYMQYKDGAPPMIEGNLNTLSLGPGTYNAYVQGGLDTRVRLTFDVTAGKLLMPE